jgi:hypothetical protein
MAHLFQLTLPFPIAPRQRRPRLERASKLVAMASFAVICGAIYACTIVASDIESAFTQKAAAGAALYMGSVVEPLAQELATRSSLSTENREALERRLASLSPGKPIVAFNLWRDDSIVFSTKEKNADPRSPPSNLRDRMLRGEVVAKIAHGGTDAAQAALVPLLEILVPIRQTGTHRIIAFAATSVLAQELVRETRAAQYASYVIIASAAFVLVLALFNLTGRLRRRIGELALQESADAHFRKRLCRANGRVFELNQRNLRRIGRDLHGGPLQLAALALLKVDALSQPADQANSIASDRVSDIAAMRKALTQCLHQIRAVSASLAPSELDDLSFPETIRTAICLHELRTARPVTCDLRDLPQSAPNALKACAYQFVSHGLSKASQQSARCSEVYARATEQENLEIELRCEMERSKQVAWLTEDIEHRRVRRHIEALGGNLLVETEAEQHLRITARFGLARLGAPRAAAAPAA